jgi:adenosylcobinamide-phosphate synthase
VPIDPFWLVPAALALDAVIGAPDRVWRHWPHPVMLARRHGAGLDGGFNRPAWRPRLRGLAGVARWSSW